MRLDYPWILAQESRCLLARASFAAEIPQIDESRLLEGKGMPVSIQIITKWIGKMILSPRTGGAFASNGAPSMPGCGIGR